jgi:hypothetical protein
LPHYDKHQRILRTDDHFIGIAVHGDQALVSSIWCIKIIDRHDLVPQGSSRGV